MCRCRQPPSANPSTATPVDNIAGSSKSTARELPNQVMRGGPAALTARHAAAATAESSKSVQRAARIAAAADEEAAAADEKAAAEEAAAKKTAAEEAATKKAAAAQPVPRQLLNEVPAAIGAGLIEDDHNRDRTAPAAADDDDPAHSNDSGRCSLLPTGLSNSQPTLRWSFPMCLALRISVHSL